MTTFNVYARENVSDPKTTLATGLTSPSYSVGGLTKGKKYLFSVGAEKNGVEKLSEEKVMLFGQEWAPSNLNSPAKIRYDSDNAVKDGANRISKLTDLSGNNYHATQSNTSKMPVFINNTIKFNGESHELVIDSGANNITRAVSEAWIAVVFSQEELAIVNAESRILVFTSNQSAYRLGLNVGQATANKNILFFGGRRLDSEAYVGVRTPSEILAGHNYIVVGYANYQANTLQLFVDGSLVDEKKGAFTSAGTTSNTSSSTVRLGTTLTSNPSTVPDLNLTAVLAGNTHLSTTDRQKLEGYLAHKYGLTTNLPEDHPYKSLVPVL